MGEKVIVMMNSFITGNLGQTGQVVSDVEMMHVSAREVGAMMSLFVTALTDALLLNDGFGFT